jgi:hypothetical protein
MCRTWLTRRVRAWPASLRSVVKPRRIPEEQQRKRTSPVRDSKKRAQDAQRYPCAATQVNRGPTGWRVKPDAFSTNWVVVCQDPEGGPHRRCAVLTGRPLERM